MWDPLFYSFRRCFEFDIPKQEALGCVYIFFIMAGLEGAKLVAAAYICGIRSFIFVGIVLLVVGVVLCHR